LLSSLPPRAAASPFVDIEQGYLPGTTLVERLRLERDGNGERRWRTVKAGRGLRRIELEEPCDAELFSALWPFTAGRRLTKRRYFVREANNGLVWEVANFTDRELVLAEVELAGLDSPVTLPGWLEPYVVREVTGSSEYVNSELAR